MLHNGLADGCTSPQARKKTDRQVKRHEFVRQEHEQTGNQRFVQIKLNRVFPPEPHSVRSANFVLNVYQNFRINP